MSIQELAAFLKQYEVSKEKELETLKNFQQRQQQGSYPLDYEAHKRLLHTIIDQISSFGIKNPTIISMEVPLSYPDGELAGKLDIGILTVLNEFYIIEAKNLQSRDKLSKFRNSARNQLMRACGYFLDNFNVAPTALLGVYQIKGGPKLYRIRF